MGILSWTMASGGPNSCTRTAIIMSFAVIASPSLTSVSAGTSVLSLSQSRAGPLGHHSGFSRLTGHPICMQRSRLRSETNRALRLELRSGSRLISLGIASPHAQDSARAAGRVKLNAIKFYQTYREHKNFKRTFSSRGRVLLGS
jgi:hypothetical protein